MTQPTPPEEMTGDDAAYLLGALDAFVYSVEENVSGDFSRDIDQSLWDDYGKALNVLREYGMRPPPQFFRSKQHGA